MSPESTTEPYVTTRPLRTIFPQFTSVKLVHMTQHEHLTCDDFVTNPLL